MKERAILGALLLLAAILSTAEARGEDMNDTPREAIPPIHDTFWNNDGWWKTDSTQPEPFDPDKAKSGEIYEKFMTKGDRLTVVQFKVVEPLTSYEYERKDYVQDGVNKDRLIFHGTGSWKGAADKTGDWDDQHLHREGYIPVGGLVNAKVPPGDPEVVPGKDEGKIPPPMEEKGDGSSKPPRPPPPPPGGHGDGGEGGSGGGDPKKDDTAPVEPPVKYGVGTPPPAPVVVNGELDCTETYRWSWESNGRNSIPHDHPCNSSYSGPRPYPVKGGLPRAIVPVRHVTPGPVYYTGPVHHGPPIVTTYGPVYNAPPVSGVIVGPPIYGGTTFVRPSVSASPRFFRGRRFR